MTEYKPQVPASSVKDMLAAIAGREPPCPQINIAMANGHRISLTNWYLAEDAVVERWPNGSPRYLVLIGQMVVVEIPEDVGRAAP